MSCADHQAFHALTSHAHGFMVSQVLFTACELGVFDLLAVEPLEAQAVAARLGSSLRGTGMLLDACVSLGLLDVRMDGDTALYANTSLSGTYLVSASPRSQASMFLYLAGTTYQCWGHLAQAVREGTHQYRSALGIESLEPFAAIYRSAAERLRFMRGLQEVWSVCGTLVLTAFDLSTFPIICDLGGGSGALAKACVSLYPDCEVTVFDIPEVVRTVRTNFPQLDKERVTFQEGDFFQDPLPEADLYVLARILHDWTDAMCTDLLARIHCACRPGGGVLLVESLLDEDGRGPLHAQLFSLNMLLQTDGQERTAAQYCGLAAAAGFQHWRCHRTGCVYDVMLLRKGAAGEGETGAPPESSRAS